MNNNYLFLFILILFFSCNENDDLKNDPITNNFETKNVIILVVDGPRMHETWFDSNRINIPNRVNLLREGVLISNFKNNGSTLTMSGHSSILNGTYEHLLNDGSQSPENPSMLQLWLKQSNESNNKAWIITSKVKLKTIANCVNTSWKDQFLPSTDCGNPTTGTTDRTDIQTVESFKNILNNYQPKLVMINLKEVDAAGHNNDWNGYINGIKNTDAQIKEIWNFIQSSNNYKNKTALIVTNDHGRHDDNNGGFQHHGDQCGGCTSIEFFALGPDFKKNVTISTGNYEQKDIAKTIGLIMGFEMPFSDGKIIKEIFSKNIME